MTAVRVGIGDVALDGDLVQPPGAAGAVVFAHGSGSSRHSGRNRQVATALQQAGLATLLFDLLTADEDVIDARTREFRFDIGLLAGRLVAVIDWVARHGDLAGLAIGCFGASTGAAAALIAAARRPDLVAAVVSRGGRPDLAAEALTGVRAPSLLIVGGNDTDVLDLNRRALSSMSGDHALEVVPGATHLFPEPGALETVQRLAADWFTRHLPRGGAQ